MWANTNMDPQSPTLKEEVNLPPTPFLVRRPSSSSPSPPVYSFHLLSLSCSDDEPEEDMMSGPIRTSDMKDLKIIQPPRPPNAWILYRSDKLRDLPPLPTGSARRAQADVSRLISTMWKEEKLEVRAEYERLADAKKAEHQAKYPGYRFQPMKKEDRDRLREERKQNKESKRTRGRAPMTITPIYATQVAPPPLPHPFAPYYHTEVRYGPAGPSPPLSAAPSPLQAGSSSESRSPQDQAVYTTDASPYSDAQNSGSTSAVALPSATPALYSDISQLIDPSLLLATVARWQAHNDQQPQPEQQPQPQFVQQQQPQAQQSSAAVNYNPTLWDNPPQDQSGHASGSNTLSFDLSTVGMSNFDWANQEPNFEQMQALLTSTGDSAIFQLSGFDATSLTEHPSGEIEVSMGQMPFPFSVPEQNTFTGFDDFNFLDAFNNSTAPPDQSIDPLATLNSSYPDPNEYGEFNADEFLNFDNQSTSGSTSRVTSGSHLQPIQQNEEAVPSAPPPHTPYVPPAGAAYASTRRVGASWKPNFAVPDSPIDHSSSRSWGVPAS